MSFQLNLSTACRPKTCAFSYVELTMFDPPLPITNSQFQICISSLQAVTTFSDESHAAAETLDKFKSWFWSVVEGLSSLEKQVSLSSILDSL